MFVNSAFWLELERHGPASALVLSEYLVISYAELAARADRWAQQYATVLPEVAPLLISLQITADVDCIAAYLGALRAGHAVILSDCTALEPNHPIRTLYRPNLLVKPGPDGVQVILADPEPVPMHPDLRVLLSTSGTTGAPKLVRLSDKNLQANAQSIATYLGLGPQERAITTLPLYYSYGMSVLHAHLAAGGSLVLTDLSIVNSEFWALFRAVKATSLAFVPHQFDLLESLHLDKLDVPSLRYITQAGGKLARSKVQKFHTMGQSMGWKLVIMYGQTEASPRISYIPPDALGDNSDTIGQSIPGGRLWIADDEGHPVTQPGRAGELIYEGPNVMLGYAEERCDLANVAGPEQLYTGDIAELTGAGFFRIVGRKKRFVKLFGLRVSLDQLDQDLIAAGHAGFCLNVDDRLVVLHTDPEAGPAIAAHLVQAYDLPVDAMLTAPLEKTPLLSSGKIDYRGLQDLAVAARDAERATAPASGQVSLRETIARATRNAKVGDGDTFSALGGDSLGYLQVTLALEEHLGHVPDGWENMPVLALEQIDRSESQGGFLDADVVVRLVAVSLIVIRHTTGWPIGGGTWMLLTVIGYSMARFGFAALVAGRPLKLFFQMIYPLLPLYYLILFAFMTVGMHPSIGMLNLTANLAIPGWNQGNGLVSPNWFVSLYLQLLILVIGTLSLPPVLSVMQRAPWLAGLTGLAGSLLISLVWQALNWPDMAANRDAWIDLIRVPMTCLPFVLLGWCIFHARTGRQRALAVLAAVATVGVFPAPSIDYSLVILSLSLYLLVGPRIPVPMAVSKVLRVAASTTLFVFLLHGVAIWVLLYATPLSVILGPVLSSLLALLSSFAMAWMAKRGFDLFDQFTLTWLRVARQPKSARGKV